MTKPGDLLAAFIDAMRADSSNESDIANTLRTAAVLLGSAPDLTDGKKAYVISLSLDVKAQNQEEAVEKAYGWMRAAEKGHFSFDVRRPGTTVQLENPPPIDFEKLLKPE